MAGTLDLIKQYLVGIGFQIDDDSLKKANSSINNAEDNIKKFNDNNKKGFSESSDGLKDLFSLFNIFTQGIGKLSPELRTPFQNMIKDVLLLAKIYAQFNEQLKKQPNNKTSNSENMQESKQEQPTTNDKQSTSIKSLATIPKNELKNTNLIDQVLNTKDATKNLAEEGTENVAKFSLGAAAKFAVVATAAVAVVAGIKKIISGILDLANQDIENEKLSRQLWTTKENAKEVDMAMKTLGVSMQDLWLSPTLLKQFNQLRQDSKELKLPKEYTDNLKIVQGTTLEFSRLKQLGSLAFQWIGNSILKYAAGPLNDLRQTIHSLNDWLIKNIPNIGKVVGGIIGVLIKIIAIILKIGAVLFKLTSPIFNIIELIGKIQDKFESLPEPVKKVLKEIALLIIGLAAPILVLLGLLDDLMAYFKGGKSLTGTFIDKVGRALDNIGEKIKNVLAYFKKLKDEVMNSSIVKGLEGFKNGIAEGINDIKKFDFKGLLGNLNTKINGVSASNMNNLVSNYTTSNIRNMNSSTTTTQNSHNTIKNDNKFYVYGGSDANSTGKAVKNNVNGIVLRNLQGGY
jgi:hypothetical protein